MDKQFEAVGDLADWPKNEPAKPTQACVFGVYRPDRPRQRFEMLWAGRFPDLETAMYWAAKKEMGAVRKDKWVMASRILWQHELTPEQALAAVRQQMEPQVDRALRSYRRGGDPFDVGDGPMRPVDPSNPNVTKYVEIIPPGGDDPVASFVVPPAEKDKKGGDRPAGPGRWIPRNPLVDPE